MAAANFVLALFAALAMRKLLSTETDAAVALLLVASATVTVILSRAPGEHGIASGLLSPIRRSTFWSGVTVYAVAAVLVLTGQAVNGTDDLYIAPAWSAESFARLAAAANFVRAAAVYVRYKLSTGQPFMVGRRRRHYLRNTLWLGAISLTAVAMFYGALIDTTVRAGGGPLHVHVEPRGDRLRGERPREVGIPRERVAFRAGHKLTLGVTLRNPGFVGVSVMSVSVPTGNLADDTVVYVAQASGPPGPEPLTPFRPFALPRRSAERYVEVHLLLRACAPAVRSVTIDHLHIAVRRGEVPLFGGDKVEFPTPLVVDIPPETWCSAGTAALARDVRSSFP